MWLDLLLSTVAFFVSARWLKRYLEEQDIPAGMVRNLMVVVIATAISFAVSSMVSWLDDEQAPDAKLMQSVGQTMQMLR